MIKKNFLSNFWMLPTRTFAPQKFGWYYVLHLRTFASNFCPKSCHAKHKQKFGEVSPNFCSAKVRRAKHDNTGGVCPQYVKHSRFCQIMPCMATFVPKVAAKSNKSLYAKHDFKFYKTKLMPQYKSPNIVFSQNGIALSKQINGFAMRLLRIELLRTKSSQNQNHLMLSHQNQLGRILKNKYNKISNYAAHTGGVSPQAGPNNLPSPLINKNNYYTEKLKASFGLPRRRGEYAPSTKVFMLFVYYGIIDKDRIQFKEFLKNYKYEKLLNNYKEFNNLPNGFTSRACTSHASPAEFAEQTLEAKATKTAKGPCKTKVLDHGVNASKNALLYWALYSKTLSNNLISNFCMRGCLADFAELCLAWQLLGQKLLQNPIPKVVVPKHPTHLRAFFKKPYNTIEKDKKLGLFESSGATPQYRKHLLMTNHYISPKPTYCFLQIILEKYLDSAKLNGMQHNQETPNNCFSNQKNNDWSTSDSAFQILAKQQEKINRNLKVDQKRCYAWQAPTTAKDAAHNVLPKTDEKLGQDTYSLKVFKKISNKTILTYWLVPVAGFAFIYGNITIMPSNFWDKSCHVQPGGIGFAKWQNNAKRGSQYAKHDSRTQLLQSKRGVISRSSNNYEMPESPAYTALDSSMKLRATSSPIIILSNGSDAYSFCAKEAKTNGFNSKQNYAKAKTHFSTINRVGFKDGIASNKFLNGFVLGALTPSVRSTIQQNPSKVCDYFAEWMHSLQNVQKTCKNNNWYYASDTGGGYPQVSPLYSNEIVKNNLNFIKRQNQISSSNFCSARVCFANSVCRASKVRRGTINFAQYYVSHTGGVCPQAKHTKSSFIPKRYYSCNTQNKQSLKLLKSKLIKLAKADNYIAQILQSKSCDMQTLEVLSENQLSTPFTSYNQGLHNLSQVLKNPTSSIADFKSNFKIRGDFSDISENSSYHATHDGCFASKGRAIEINKSQKPYYLGALSASTAPSMRSIINISKLTNLTPNFIINLDNLLKVVMVPISGANAPSYTTFAQQPVYYALQNIQNTTQGKASKTQHLHYIDNKTKLLSNYFEKYCQLSQEKNILLTRFAPDSAFASFAVEQNGQRPNSALGSVLGALRTFDARHTEFAKQTLAEQKFGETGGVSPQAKHGNLPSSKKQNILSSIGDKNILLKPLKLKLNLMQVFPDAAMQNGFERSSGRFGCSELGHALHGFGYYNCNPQNKASNWQNTAHKSYASRGHTPLACEAWHKDFCPVQKFGENFCSARVCFANSVCRASKVQRGITTFAQSYVSHTGGLCPQAQHTKSSLEHKKVKIVKKGSGQAYAWHTEGGCPQVIPTRYYIGIKELVLKKQAKSRANRFLNSLSVLLSSSQLLQSKSCDLRHNTTFAEQKLFYAPPTFVSKVGGHNQEKMFKNNAESMNTHLEAYAPSMRSIILKKLSIQKKRKAKKQRLETRRQKKRIRFFPRPVWLRYRLFLNLINQRLIRYDNAIANIKQDTKLVKLPLINSNKSNKFRDSYSAQQSRKNYKTQLKKLVYLFNFKPGSTFQFVKHQRHTRFIKLNKQNQSTQNKVEPLRSSCLKKSFERFDYYASHGYGYYSQLDKSIIKKIFKTKNLNISNQKSKANYSNFNNEKKNNSPPTNNLKTNYQNTVFRDFWISAYNNSLTKSYIPLKWFLPTKPSNRIMWLCPGGIGFAKWQNNAKRGPQYPLVPKARGSHNFFIKSIKNAYKKSRNALRINWALKKTNTNSITSNNKRYLLWGTQKLRNQSTNNKTKFFEKQFIRNWDYFFLKKNLSNFYKKINNKLISKNQKLIYITNTNFKRSQTPKTQSIVFKRKDIKFFNGENFLINQKILPVMLRMTYAKHEILPKQISDVPQHWPEFAKQTPGGIRPQYVKHKYAKGYCGGIMPRILGVYAPSHNIEQQYLILGSCIFLHLCALISLVTISQVRCFSKFHIILLYKLSNFYNSLIEKISNLIKIKKVSLSSYASPVGIRPQYVKHNTEFAQQTLAEQKFGLDKLPLKPFEDASHLNSVMLRILGADAPSQQKLEAKYSKNVYNYASHLRTFAPQKFGEATRIASFSLNLLKSKLTAKPTPGSAFYKKLLHNNTSAKYENSKLQQHKMLLTKVNMVSSKSLFLKYIFSLGWPLMLSLKTSKQKQLSKLNENNLVKKQNIVYHITQKIFYLNKNKIVLVKFFKEKTSFISFNLINIFQKSVRTVSKFFEKPAEFTTTWIAFGFLIEWSSDLINVIPENIDIFVWDSFYKLTRVIPIQFFLYSNSGTISLLLTKTGLNITTIMQRILGADAPGFDPLNKLAQNSLLLKTSNIIISHLFYRRILHLMDAFIETISQPDTDLISRQEKGTLFWDIWADFLVTAADYYNVNIAALSTIKAEQNLLIKKISNNFDLNFQLPAFVEPMHASHTHSVLYMMFHTLGANAPKMENQKERNSGKVNMLFLKKQVQYQENIILNKIINSCVVGPGSTLPKLSPMHSINSIKGNKSKGFVVSSNDRWSINQFLTYQSCKNLNTSNGDLFIDFHSPKAFANIPTIKYNKILQQPIGTLVCQIYSGIFSKEISKNLLLVNMANSLEPSSDYNIQLIQALAGETELKIIRDNAHRYALVNRGFAIGIKLLKDVFFAIALNTPCIFLLEDLHAIGERRPMLLSDYGSSPGSNLSNAERDEVHEKNQVVYQLTRHSIAHYKKPFKGDYSLAIPTNLYSLDLFLKQPSQSTSNLSLIVNHNLTLKNKIKIRSQNNKKAPVQTQHHSLTKTLKTKKANSTYLTPPSTSPFSVLLLKEEKKLKQNKIIEEIAWTGVSVSSLGLQDFQRDSGKHDETKPRTSYSVRAKVSMLAELSLSNITAKLDMITDLLVIIDSVRSNKGFVVFATTNMPHVLDPALRRPGRFDETICLPNINTSSISYFFRNYELIKSVNSVAVLSKALPVQPFFLNRHFNTNMLRSSSLTVNYKDYNTILRIKTHHNQSADTLTLNNALISYSKKIKQKTKKPGGIRHQYPQTFGRILLFSKICEASSPNFCGAKVLPELLLMQSMATFGTKVARKSSGSSAESCFAYCLRTFGARHTEFAKQTLAEQKFGELPGHNPKHKAAKMSEGQTKHQEIDKLTNRKLLYFKAIAYQEVGKIMLQYYLTSVFTQHFADQTQLNLKSINYLSLYGLKNKFLLQLMLIFGGKVALLLSQKSKYLSNNLLLNNNKKNYRDQGFSLVNKPFNFYTKKILDSEIFENNHNLKLATSLMLFFIHKRYLYLKNLILPQLLSFTEGTLFEEPAGPPFSSLLIPAKRFENYKRLFRDSFIGDNMGQRTSQIPLIEKQHYHTQVNKIKLLNNKQDALLTNVSHTGGVSPQEVAKQNLVKTSKGQTQNLVENRMMLCMVVPNGTTQSIMSNYVQTPTTINWYYQNLLLKRHGQYLTNQWFNGQLSEHNTETVFLSDIDWRSSFIKEKQNNVPQLKNVYTLLKQKKGYSDTNFLPKSNSISKSQDLNQNGLDILLDFPDTDQYYNPRRRRWLLNKGYWSFWFNLDKVYSEEIIKTWLLESIIQTYTYLYNNTELLDFITSKFIILGYPNYTQFNLNQKLNLTLTELSTVKEIIVTNSFKRF